MKYSKRSKGVPSPGDIYRRSVYQNNKFPYLRVRVDCFNAKKEDELIVEYHMDRICIYPIQSYDKEAAILAYFKSGKPLVVIADRFSVTEGEALEIIQSAICDENEEDE